MRIAIAGMSGPITVKGVAYNSAMPPPPGLTDDQIAEAVTYARTNFGNKASAVDAAFGAPRRCLISTGTATAPVRKRPFTTAWGILRVVVGLVGAKLRGRRESWKPTNSTAVA